MVTPTDNHSLWQVTTTQIQKEGYHHYWSLFTDITILQSGTDLKTQHGRNNQIGQRTQQATILENQLKEIELEQ